MKLLRRLALLVVLLAVVTAAAAVVSPRVRHAATWAWLALRAQPAGSVSREAAHGSTVVLEGEVDAVLATPFSRDALFVLRDGTGAVHVTWDGGAPRRGDRAVVVGRVDREPGPLRGLVSGGVVVDAERVLFRAGASPDAAR